MNKLTAEVARMDIRHLKSFKANPQVGLSMAEEKYLQALEIALPILEQQERGEEADIISTPQYVLDEKWKSHFGLNQQPPAKPQDSRGEWIEWNGGECPTTKVEVKYRNGHLRTENAGGFRWYHLHNDFDIIAYRIIPERATNQNGEQ